MAQTAQLAELLVRAVRGSASDHTLVRDTLDALTSVPREHTKSVAEDEAAAVAIFDRLERLMLSDPAFARDSDESISRLHTLRRRFMSAGKPDSGLAPFKHKANMLSVLEHLAFSHMPDAEPVARVQPRAPTLLPSLSADTHTLSHTLSHTSAATAAPTSVPSTASSGAFSFQSAVSMATGPRAARPPSPPPPEPPKFVSVGDEHSRTHMRGKCVAGGGAPDPVTPAAASTSVRADGGSNKFGATQAHADSVSRTDLPREAGYPAAIAPAESRTDARAGADAPGRTNARLRDHSAAGSTVQSPAAGRHTGSASPLPAQAQSPSLFTAASSLLLPPESECELLRDCLRVLQGVDGRHLRYRHPPDAARAYVPAFEDSIGVVPTDTPSLVIPDHVRAMLHGIGACGDLFRTAQACVHAEPDWDAREPDAAETVANGGVPPRGGVRQAFMSAIQREIDQHLRSLAELEAEIGSMGLEVAVRQGSWSIQRLLAWTERPSSQLELLCVILAAGQGLHGGALLSALWSHTQRSDATTRAIAQRVLAAAAVPYVTQIREWVTTGELRAHQHISSGSRPQGTLLELAARMRDADFFICCDPDVPLHDAWHHRFAMIPTHIPSFMSAAVARHIFTAGKTVHFVRTACNDAEWIVKHVGAAVTELHSSGLLRSPSTGMFALPLGVTTVATPKKALATAAGADAPSADDREAQLARLVLERRLLEQLHGPDVSGMLSVDALLSVIPPLVNGRLLSRMLDGQKLLLHLRAIQRYLLLTQGDFVSILLASIAPELGKPAASLGMTRHLLEGFVESAIRASNAQFEAKDVLNRISVYLLAASPGDTGWDVFSLAYEVTPPLSVVITPAALETYARMFHFLWRVKRVEHSLSVTWSAHMTSSHSLRSLRHAGLDAILHTCHLLRTDMTNFLSTLVNYLTYEALSTAWDTLESRITSAQDLNALLEAHDAYLATVVDRAMLSDRTRSVAAPMQALLTEILKFSTTQEVLIEAALEQVAVQKAHYKSIRQRSRDGDWGVPSGAVDEETLHAQIAEALDGIVAAYGPRLADVAMTYRARMMEFLDSIDATSQNDGLEELKLLVLRFDYNGYYTGAA